MDEQILIYAAILVAVIVLTIVGILSRYRKCKSDEVLVVYGRPAIRNRLNCITEEPLLYGPSSRDTLS